jgi:hypothetical protein
MALEPAGVVPLRETKNVFRSSILRPAARHSPTLARSAGDFHARLLRSSAPDRPLGQRGVNLKTPRAFQAYTASRGISPSRA